MAYNKERFKYVCTYPQPNLYIFYCIEMPLKLKTCNLTVEGTLKNQSDSSSQNDTFVILIRGHHNHFQIRTQAHC